MNISESININGSPDQIWKVITDIKGSENTISAIQDITILEKPEAGLVGLKWEETREMFGREAKEVMWITDVEEGASYQTRAENNGAVYISGLSIQKQDEDSILTMNFEGEALTLGARLMSFLTGFLFKNATVQAIRKDLKDIKSAVEKNNSAG